MLGQIKFTDVSIGGKFFYKPEDADPSQCYLPLVKVEPYATIRKSVVYKTEIHVISAHLLWCDFLDKDKVIAKCPVELFPSNLKEDEEKLMVWQLKEDTNSEKGVT